MKKNYGSGLLIMLAIACCLLESRALAQNAVAKWEKFDFSTQVINDADVKAMSLDNLKLLRGIIFGRHGRIFKEQDIQDFLDGRSWYKADDQFRNSMLNDTERKNLDKIRGEESAKHKQIEPGDLRFYQNQAFTQAALGTHSLAELRVMRAEIEAIHGARFDDEPWLQTYFEDRYWYSPAKYNPATLSEIERKNIATISEAEKTQRGLKILPGDMIVFQNKKLTEDQLHGLGLYELRLLRNEIYALHGRQFNTIWLQDHFDSQPWYQYNPDFKDDQLSATEVANVATIVAYENKVHENLGIQPVSTALLTGLFLEDARKLRNEIFARHGRTFKDKWLQGYFSSFSWYKANPNYSDNLLNPVEKKNVATILAYESTAERGMKR